eukprot:gb/GFBE01030391.1/.p1 GENE.gb/GFBE01030391.1/~~gb/GFBE01030391.1/.p1  ORF type:complete len:285 (+),score=48.59 gb/GFBE01030391.1/:1-855(+)
MPDDETDVPVLTIACCGDSLTESGYPAELQRTLCAEHGRDISWRVINLGLSGATAKHKPLGYARSPAFQRALECAADIVALLLGTNDAHQALWDEAQFVDCLSFIVRQLQEAGAKKGRRPPMIFLGVPPPLYHTDHLLSYRLKQNVVNEDLPRIIPRLAKDLGVGVFDAFSYMGGPKLLRPDSVVPDGVHLSQVGKQLLAKLVAETVIAYDGLKDLGSRVSEAEVSVSSESSDDVEIEFDDPDFMGSPHNSLVCHCAGETVRKAKSRSSRSSSNVNEGAGCAVQ